MVLNHLVRRAANDPATAFVAAFGFVRFGALTLLLAIRRWRL
jgi:hypothetical protein